MKKTSRFLAAVMVFVFTFSMLTSSFSGTVLVSESTGEEFLFDIVVISDESLDSDKNVKEKTFNISPIISESDSSIEEKSDIYIMKDVIEDVDTKQFTDIEISLKESLELYYQYELELLSKENNTQIISQRYKNTESAEIWDIEIGTDYEFYMDLFSENNIRKYHGNFVVSEDSEVNLNFEKTESKPNYEHISIEDPEEWTITEDAYEDIYSDLKISSFISKEEAYEAKHIRRLSEYDTSDNIIGFENADGTNTVYLFSSLVRYKDSNDILHDAETNFVKT